MLLAVLCPITCFSNCSDNTIGMQDVSSDVRIILPHCQFSFQLDYTQLRKKKEVGIIRMRLGKLALISIVDAK